MAGPNPGRTNTQGLKKITEENVLPLLWHLQIVRHSIFFFRIKKKNRRPRLTAVSLFRLLWDVKESTMLFVKSRGRRPWWCGTTFHRLVGG